MKITDITINEADNLSGCNQNSKLNGQVRPANAQRKKAQKDVEKLASTIAETEEKITTSTNNTK